MKSNLHKFQLFANLCLVFLISILGLFAYLLLQEQKLQSNEAIAFCSVETTAIRTASFDSNRNFDQGKTLFRNYCASCHNKNMKSDMTGPALAGIEERWSPYPREDLYNWIRNSQAMIAQNHPRAVELWKDWQPTIMTSFDALTDEQIEDMIAYIEVEYY